MSNHTFASTGTVMTWLRHTHSALPKPSLGASSVPRLHHHGQGLPPKLDIGDPDIRHETLLRMQGSVFYANLLPFRSSLETQIDWCEGGLTNA